MTTITDISGMDAAELRGTAARLIHENDKLRRDNKELAERKSRKVRYSQFLYHKSKHGWGYGEQKSDRPWFKTLEFQYPMHDTLEVLAEECLSPAGVCDRLSLAEAEIDQLKRQLVAAQNDFKRSEQDRMMMLEARGILE